MGHKKPTFVQWIIMKDISLLKINEEITVRELAFLLNRPETDKNFSIVKKILIKNGIIHQRDTNTTYKLLTIDIKKLDRFLEDTWIWDQFAEYVHNKKLIYDAI